MGLFIDHVNLVLSKLREQAVTTITTGTASPDMNTEQWRAQEAVRRAVNRVWNFKQWEFKKRSFTFSTTIGRLEYPLPPQIGDIFSFLCAVPPYTITSIPESQFDKYVPNPIETGVPEWVRFFGESQILLQPTASSIVTLVSSSAADTGVICYIKGADVNGSPRVEQVILNGIVPVSSSHVYSSLVYITKNVQTDGIITATMGATVVSQLFEQELEHWGKVIRFYPIPDNAYAITIKYLETAPNLRTTYESTCIPPKWDYVIDQWAYTLALQSKGQEQSQEFTNQFNLAVKFLEQDMASEEIVAVDQIITPLRWASFIGGQGAAGTWGTLPPGYGFTI